ncbi:class I SAM-dependent RNA methyltransferase [Thermodesulfobacteriota bacterium]
MTCPGNIEKRIKRHVLGKNRSFFISTVPGYESLCRDELLSLNLSSTEFNMFNGGIDFSARVHECYLANIKLRTANRILMRLDLFKATNFRQLDRKIAAFPWELYLYPGRTPDVHVTAKQSRLFHTDAVADHFKEGICQHAPLASVIPPTDANHLSYTQQIFVRVIDDRLTVSIDSSGELLHKRGLKIHGGKAPLRETIAASILLYAGFNGNEPLVDPMCGSGTFSLEGAMMANHIPAGWYREFAFMGWPCFKRSRWTYIRREAQKRIDSSPRFQIFASDKDDHACKSLKHTIQNNRLQDVISVSQRDFFDLQPIDILRQAGTRRKGLLVLNPPYGHRLERTGKSQKGFIEICQKMSADFKGWKFALIVPDKSLLKQIPFKASTKHLLHGGLTLTLATGRVE